MEIISVFSAVVGLFGVGFGFWHLSRSSHIKKIINDHIRDLYFDTKEMEKTAKKKKEEELEKMAESVKGEIIRLDIINRNLNREKIDNLKKEKKFTNEECEEYKKLSSE